MKKFVILVPMLLAFAFGQNFLTNGDFEQDLSVGWVQTQGGYSTVTVDRATGYQPDPDYEARDSICSGSGWSRLSQVVDAPGTRLILSFSGKFAIYGASSSCWPVAYVAVSYYDGSDALLGESRIYHHDSYCTWTPSSTLSLIEVTNPDWTDYSLDIAQELSEHLPGVNPGDISKIGIAISDTTAGG
jgi:hypothetical protein